jgi:putative endonuclease
MDYYVYILANAASTVLYVGVTNDLARRVFEHKGKFVAGFTSRYNVPKLVYYELFDEPESAITREKQLKAGSRKKKMALIDAVNPAWDDLYEKL